MFRLPGDVIQIECVLAVNAPSPGFLLVFEVVLLKDQVSLNHPCFLYIAFRIQIKEIYWRLWLYWKTFREGFLTVAVLLEYSSAEVVVCVWNYACLPLFQ